MRLKGHPYKKVNKRIGAESLIFFIKFAFLKKTFKNVWYSFKEAFKKFIKEPKIFTLFLP